MTGVRRLAGAAAASSLLIALTACGDDKGGTDTIDTPDPTGSTSAPATDEEQATQVLTDYLAARDQAYRDLRADAPALDTLSSGAEFQRVREELYEFKAWGVTTTGQWKHTLGTPQGSGDTLTITDCEDRSGVTTLTKGGKPFVFTGLDGKPLADPVLVSYTLTSPAGEPWTVDSQTYVEGGRSC